MRNTIMKHIVSLLFLISSCINFAADKLESAKSEQKKNRIHKLLKVAVPVVGAAIGLAYLKHQQMPDMNSIYVHMPLKVNPIPVPIENRANYLTVCNYLKNRLESKGISYDFTNAYLEIGYRKHFYSLFRTFSRIYMDNIQKIITDRRSNDFWLRYKAA